MDDLRRAQERLGRALDRARAGEDKVLATVVREEGERLVKLLNGVLGLAKLHALDNRAFDQPIHELEVILGRLFELLGAVHVISVEDQVYVNEIRIRLEGGEAAQDLGGKLQRHRLGGISFHAPLDEAQLRIFVASLAAPAADDRPRHAVREALAARGMHSVELAGVHRFRVSGEKEPVQTRDARTIAASAAGLVDEAWEGLSANRLPNPLPLRRVVTEIIEAGAGADALWDDPDGASPYAAHTLRVCCLALLLGRALGLPEGALQDLGVAAMFHDVGYAAREGAEVKDGRAVSGYAPPFERHPTAGARLLLRQRGFHEAKVRRVLATLDHHRRLDDPGERPSLFGRILAVVEDYDTWIRPGGGACPPSEALGRLVAAAGKVYDPLLVQLFVNALGPFPPGTQMTLADGRSSRVVSFVRSRETFETPIVRVDSAGGGAPSGSEALIDLAERPDLRPKGTRPAPPPAHPAAGPPERAAPPRVSEAPPAPPPSQQQASAAQPPGASAGPESHWATLSGPFHPLFPGVLPRLLHDIYAREGSGFLYLLRGQERRCVRFWRGEIAYGRSTVREEQLEEVAIREGLLTREDLDRAGALAGREHAPLSAILCGLGMLSLPQLQELIAQHAREVLIKAIPWTDGSYQFDPNADEPSSLERLPSHLTTANVILEAARAIHDPDVVAWHLGDIDRVIVPAGDLVRHAESCKLTPFDAFVLSRADGQLTAREIVSIVPDDSEHVQRALFGLLCIGLVRFAAAEGHDTPPTTHGSGSAE